MSNLTRKYDEQTRKTKILKYIAEGYTPNQIATKLKITKRYIDSVLKEELASTETPEKILAMRDLQSAQIQTHTPRLAQRFIKQSDLQNKLTDKYAQMVDEEHMTYPHLYDQYIAEGYDPEQADTLAKQDLAQYYTLREQLSKEVERISKQTDQTYRTYLEQQKRLSQLHGTDTPTQHHMLISRTDEIRIELQQEILKTQKEIEAQKNNIIEAEIIEEEPK